MMVCSDTLDSLAYLDCTHVRLTFFKGRHLQVSKISSVSLTAVNSSVFVATGVIVRTCGVAIIIFGCVMVDVDSMQTLRQSSHVDIDCRSSLVKLINGDLTGDSVIIRKDLAETCYDYLIS